MPLADDRPNILLILSDQHRHDCVGYRGSQAQTPHLDRLAAEATVYTDAFCASPVCTPSRYSLLTGLYPHQHGAWSNESTPHPGLPTFPRLLRDAGYRTAAVGKMHFTPTYLDIGFDELELAEQHGRGRYEDDYHRWLQAHNRCDWIDVIDQVDEERQRAPSDYWETFGALPFDQPERFHSTSWIGERAVRRVARWSSGGNCLMVGFVKPHHPFDPPQSWIDRYDPDALDLLPGWTDRCLEHDLAYRENHFSYRDMTEAQYRRVLTYYFALLSQMDHQIGRILDTLRTTGQYDNTLIVYTSDHGDYMGYHHLLLKGNYMYDPIVRVPLVVRFPDQVQYPRRGKADRSLASLLDLSSTITSIANAGSITDGQGIDLTRGEVGRDTVFASCKWGTVEHMARSRDHKLLWCEDPAKSAALCLADDPHEFEPKSPADEPTAADLQGRLGRHLMFDAITPNVADQKAPRVKPDSLSNGQQSVSRKAIRRFVERAVTQRTPSSTP